MLDRELVDFRYIPGIVLHQLISIVIAWQRLSWKLIRTDCLTEIQLFLLYSMDNWLIEYCNWIIEPWGIRNLGIVFIYCLFFVYLIWFLCILISPVIYIRLDNWERNRLVSNLFPWVLYLGLKIDSFYITWDLVHLRVAFWPIKFLAPLPGNSVLLLGSFQYWLV